MPPLVFTYMFVNSAPVRILVVTYKFFFFFVLFFFCDQQMLILAHTNAQNSQRFGIHLSNEHYTIIDFNEVDIIRIYLPPGK